MSRIEELVESIRQKTDHYADQDFYEESIIGIMKQFAIEMCEKQKQLCLENAESDSPYHGVEKDSILDASLPEELITKPIKWP